MQDQEKNPVSGEQAAPIGAKPVKFTHERGAQYRVFHADGAWGVINHHGNLQIDFCVERPPIPTSVIQPVKPDGSPNGEHETQGLGELNYFNVIRDFQCGIVFSFAAAVQVRSLLDAYIVATQQQMNTAMAEMKLKK